VAKIRFGESAGNRHDVYNFEQKEKMRILDYLLLNFNDGRKKTFFCVAVNLSEFSELQEALNQIKSNDSLSVMTEKERCFYAADVFQKIADRRNVELRLHKKKQLKIPVFEDPR